MSYTNLIFSRFDFVLLQIVLQETEIMNQGKNRIRSNHIAHTKI